MQDTELYDIGIIGGGPAGMSAAKETSNQGKSTIIFNDKTLATNLIKTISTAKDLPYTYLNQKIALIRYRFGIFILFTPQNKTFCCKSLIFATGGYFKPLNFNTKNIYSTLDIDLNLQNKNIIITGFNNISISYALSLASYCKNVYLCDTSFNLTCSSTLSKQLKKYPNIICLTNCRIKSVQNNKENQLESIILDTNEKILVSAIFNTAEIIPQTTLARTFVQITEDNYIKIDTNYETSVSGCFATGDCCLPKNKTTTELKKAGKEAAKSAIKYLNIHKI